MPYFITDFFILDLIFRFNNYGKEAIQSYILAQRHYLGVPTMQPHERMAGGT
jgi:hypothetical protein